MSIAAAGYVLRVPPDRRELLLAEAADSGDSYYSSKPNIAEPVLRFDHSRRAPLVVFASFENGKITHIADGKRLVSAGTGLARLNMQDVQSLARPVTFRELESGVSTKVRRHLKRVLTNGGLLPPKTLGALVDRIVELDSSIAGKLARFSERRRNAIRNLKPRAAENLAFQKESLGIALEICGISRDALLEWQAPATQQKSFLDGLPGAQVREDVMLLKDFSTIPGFDLGGEVAHCGSKMFEDPRNPAIRLTVTMANRLPLEQQTGADLIYFNEAYRSFVMVQYKAMEKGTDHAEFRWKKGDQFEQEVARMDALLLELRNADCPDSPKKKAAPMAAFIYKEAHRPSCHCSINKIVR